MKKKMIEIPIKRCGRCDAYKPITEFRKAYGPFERFGVRAICRECQREYDRLYARERRAKAKADNERG